MNQCLKRVHSKHEVAKHEVVDSYTTRGNFINGVKKP